MGAPSSWTAGDHQIGPDIQIALGRSRPHTSDAAVLPDETGCFRARAQIEGRVLLPLLGQKVEKIPLRHQSDEFAVRRQIPEIGYCDPRRADLSGQSLHARVRQFEKCVEQAELVHQLERGRMNCVAAEIAQEVGVLLQYGDGHAGARQQKAEHHPGRSAADDAAGGGDRGFRH
jgi:hypothetical protein